MPVRLFEENCSSPPNQQQRTIKENTISHQHTLHERATVISSDHTDTSDKRQTMDFTPIGLLEAIACGGGMISGLTSAMVRIFRRRVHLVEEDKEVSVSQSLMRSVILTGTGSQRVGWRCVLITCKLQGQVRVEESRREGGVHIQCMYTPDSRVSESAS